MILSLFSQLLDEEAPNITNIPENIKKIELSANAELPVTWTLPTATDNVGIRNFTFSHNPGDMFPSGNTTIIYTATDLAGNQATIMFTVNGKMRGFQICLFLRIVYDISLV